MTDEPGTREDQAASEDQPVTDEVPAAVALRVEQVFAESGAYRTGHFKLKSGRHADRYIEKFQVMQWPAAMTELCGLLAEQARRSAGRIDVVAGPTTGGVLLAYEVARQLGVRGIFAEQVSDDAGATRREFRRGFRIEPGERVLLVDDVVTTGASLVEMLPPIEASGGKLVLATVLVDRSGELGDVESPASGTSYPTRALWTLALPTYRAGKANCPACAAGQPLDTPGSSGTAGA